MKPISFLGSGVIVAAAFAGVGSVQDKPTPLKARSVGASGRFAKTFVVPVFALLPLTDQ